MIDSLLLGFNKIKDGLHMYGSSLKYFEKKYQSDCLLTLHRPSNADDKRTFNGIWKAIEKLSKTIPVLFPAHPRTLDRLKRIGIKSTTDTIRIVEPLGYLDMISTINGAKLAITDSGELQGETTFLGIPCLTIRDTAERPCTVTIGTNCLVGTDNRKIYEKAIEAISGKWKKGDIPPLWDGKAVERIAERIIKIAQ